jgi:hypothetical protein
MRTNSLIQSGTNPETGVKTPDMAEVFEDIANSMSKININACVKSVDWEKFLNTIETMNELGQHDVTVIDSNNIPHTLSEYQLDTRFLPLVHPRGVFFEPGEVSPDLRTFKGSDDSVLKDAGNSILDATINGSERYAPKGSVVPMVHIDEETAPKAQGYARVDDTPAEFSAFQARVCNQFKTFIGDTVNMEDATKPVLLEDVKSWIDNGLYTLDPDGTWSHFPITIEIADAMFKPYKMSYFLDYYAKEVIKHMFVNFTKGNNSK